MKTGIDILHFLLDGLTKVEKTKAIKDLASELSLAPGTIKRWLDLEDVPEHYFFDMLKKSGQKINYDEYTSKQKDQFFTPQPTVEYCVKKSKEILLSLGEELDDILFIEPSAGDGAFLSHLPKDQTLAMDIERRARGIFERDFLSFKPDFDTGSKTVVLIGNPPFGLRGNLALRFMNHACDFVDYVCFILPQLFESDGKGAPRKRVKGLNLYHSESLKTDFYDPENRNIPVKVIFQVWAKNHTNEEFTITDSKSKRAKVYSLSLGSTSSQIRNKHMIGNCDVYLPSTCYGESKMKAYSCFEELPGKKGYGIVLLEDDKDQLRKEMLELNWAEKAFLSTNSALNLRTSMINQVIDSI